MKTIVFVLPSLKKVSPVKAALVLMENLNTNYEIIVISIDQACEEENISDILNLLNIKCYYLNANGMKNIFNARTKINQIISTVKPDISISYLLRADILNFILNSKAYKISSVRNMLEQEYILSHGKIIGTIFGKIHQYILYKLNKIIVISSDMKSYFLSKGFMNNQLELIPNFLDENELENNKIENFQMPFKNNYPVFITTASLIKRKNISLIINSAINLLSEGYKFNILILGEGEEKEYLMKLIKESSFENYFYLLGHISNPIPYVNNSHFFIMSSFSEGVSRSLMEALYLKKIVIVRNIEGNRELIDNTKNGYLYDNDIELITLMRKALDDELKPVVENYLPDTFSMKYGIEMTENLIKRILK